MASLILDRLFALAFTVLMSAAFGAGHDLDAYLLAVVTPTVIATILGDLIYSLLLPEFMSAAARAGAPDHRWSLVTWTVMALSVLTALYMACWVVGVEILEPAPSRGQILSLGLITAPLILLLGFAGLGATVLIAERRYGLASIRIPLTSLVTVLTFLIWQRLSSGVIGLAISVDAGALASAVFVAGGLVAYLGPPAMRMSKVEARVLFHRLRGASVSMLASAIVAQAVTPIERVVGFAIGPGVVSALNYGRVLVSPPLLVGQSIATAAFPRFVAHQASGEPNRHLALGRSIAMILFLLLPVSVLMAQIASPLVQLAYHHGAFDDHAASRTAVAAAILAAALAPIAVVAVITRFLYAEHASGRVALASFSALVAYAGLAITLGWAFGYAGMAAASTASYCLLSVILVLIVARTSSDGLRFIPWKDVLRTMLATAVTWAGVFGIALLAGSGTGRLGAVALVAVSCLTGGALYCVVALVLRAPELTEAVMMGRRTISRQRV